jgi:hypothetical protein
MKSESDLEIVNDDDTVTDKVDGQTRSYADHIVHMRSYVPRARYEEAPAMSAFRSTIGALTRQGAAAAMGAAAALGVNRYLGG